MKIKTVGIIVCSDKCFRHERIDTSGTAIGELATKEGYTVVASVVVPDEKNLIADALNKMCDEGISLIFTTGGTGFSRRDVTPEATKSVIEREAPGIAVAMCFYGLTLTPRAMLSRAVAGIKGESLIINLPGSEKAVRENLSFLLPALGHGIEILIGDTAECGEKKK